MAAGAPKRAINAVRDDPAGARSYRFGRRLHRVLPGIVALLRNESGEVVATVTLSADPWRAVGEVAAAEAMSVRD